MTGECRDCGADLAAGGYLCDDCDVAQLVECDCSAGWRASGGERDE